MLPWLNPDELWFPPVDTALDEPDGLLAAGGDLTPQRLLLAYHRGIFPWFSPEQPILWWAPNPRYVLQPDAIKISRSLKKTLRRGEFQITFNQAFDDVLLGCSQREETWITSEMKLAYRQLHQLGWARSVETWCQGELVGGLYGICMQRCFFGESMFTRRTDASKVALATLTKQLDRWGFKWIDCQVKTDHLVSLGAQPISRIQFSAALQRDAGPPPQLHQPPPAWPSHPAVGWG